jgi:double-stranded uracil-DNA glycosylase
MDVKRKRGETATSALPDVLARCLRVLFCGINPGRISAAAGYHFANPRNDFWRLLHAAGFTERLLAPSEQRSLLEYGLGVTNAAHRTTRGSGELRRSDFAGSAERLDRIARDLWPAWIAFVGKEAFRGAFGGHAALGPQETTLGETRLFVLPSTSPANAAVPWKERLRWFRELAALSAPVVRPAVRALLLDDQERIFLHRFSGPGDPGVWVAPGGAVREGEDQEEALRRELQEELQLTVADLKPWVWTRRHVWAWRGTVYDTRERFALVRAAPASLRPTAHDSLFAGPDYVEEMRWWTLPELESSDDEFAPRRLPQLLRDLLEQGPPAEPLETGV